MTAIGKSRSRSVFSDTVSAFVDWMNRTIDGYQSRPGFSPYHMSEFSSAFRQWRMHVWELHGSPDTLQEQLVRYYETQPVFAVLSGLILLQSFIEVGQLVTQLLPHRSWRAELLHRAFGGLQSDSAFRYKINRCVNGKRRIALRKCNLRST
jgi:hypothetical protein